MKGDRGLIHRATSTLDLAREVLGLSGNPDTASAAVFTLLGSDSRFHVDDAARLARLCRVPNLTKLP